MATPVYDAAVARGTGYTALPSGQGDILVPEPIAAEIIAEAPKSSAALTLCRRTTLSSKTERLPVLDVMPYAYWVGGDTGLKQTSNAAWKGVVMIVEELAVIIPIAQAYLDDAAVPLWSQIQPLMTQAAGQLIDQAVLFGVNKPSTWGQAIVPGAVAAGNTVADGAGADFGQDVASLGEAMALTGYTVNGFAGRPGLNWRLAGLRSAQGIPIYTSVMDADMSSSDALHGGLYGFPVAMVDNGAWDPDEAQLVAGDWTKAIIGIRQDISFKLFTEGVVSDDSGAVVLNLMQQDSVAMRMVMRLAYAVANPVTAIARDKSITQRFPFGVITEPEEEPSGGGAAKGEGAHQASAPQAARTTAAKSTAQPKDT